MSEYICPKCGKNGIYSGKKQKYIQTNCKFCHADIYIGQLLPNFSTNFTEIFIPIPEILYRKIKISGPFLKIPTEKTHEKKMISQTPFTVKSKSANSKNRQKSTFPRIHGKEKKQRKLFVEKSNSAEIKNPQNSTPSVKSDNENSWRIHNIRWTIGIISIKNGIQYEKSVDMKSFINNFLTINKCKIEIHTNCKNPNVVVNIDEPVYDNKPDTTKKITIEKCIAILDELIKLGVECDYSTIVRLQSDENAHTLENTQYKDISNGYAKNELGSAHIDQSEGHPELELIDNQLFKDGNALCQAIVDTPKQLLRIQKLNEQTATNLNNLVALLSALFKPPTPPQTEKKDENNDGIYA